ncbi:kinase-like domain-containing protein [Phycomyces blakesleeanus]|uniref:Kinase-like domain-containing protein n=1 Tax=Phycomyces blakesleeanus TaxID=4837 RepID=A0ABR3BE62_PHYBL
MSRLVREINLMEIIDHPNVVHLYETYETADSLYLVMEYVPGLNLDEYLQKHNGALQEEDARNIFRQMVAAVEYCHSRWVVHRDLKAPNVLLTPHGEVKLADFGLGNRFGLQRLKTICGSMLYYSPEIISGQKYVGPEIDCWCLGVTLFRMTAGFEPFAHAHTVGELRKDVVHGNYPMPSHLSPGLQKTIRKCLSVDRRKRVALKVALKGDGWLNDDGRLPDLLADKKTPSTSDDPDADETTRARLERDRVKRQYMKDMEDERESSRGVKKTVIYHPISTCIYYTSSTPHTSKMEDNYRAQELLRAELFQEIQANVHQFQLQLIPNLPLSDVKSPLHHIFRKFRRSEQPLNSLATPPQARLRKTTSTMSLSQLYQRVTKDQINYYTIQPTCPLSSSTTTTTSHSIDRSTTTLSSFSIPNSLRHTGSIEPTPAPAEEHDLLLLVRAACEILGITYQHDGKTRLTCVLTLRNFTIEKNRGTWFYSLVRDGPSSSTPNLLAHKSSRTSNDPWTTQAQSSGSSIIEKTKTGSRWSRQFKRLSIPLHQLPWSNSVNLNSSAAISQQGSQTPANSPPIGPTAAIITAHAHAPTTPIADPAATTNTNNAAGVPTTPTVNPADDPFGSNKDGTAIFSIEAFSVPPSNTGIQRNKDDTGTQHRMVAIRFSKTSGSTKVFKLASGWISGVLSPNEPPKTD